MRDQRVSQSVRQQTLTEHGLCARHWSRWWTVRDPKVSLSGSTASLRNLGATFRPRLRGPPGLGEGQAQS